MIGYRDLKLDADFDPHSAGPRYAGLDDDGVLVFAGWPPAGTAFAPLDGQLRLRADGKLTLELFADIVEPTSKLDLDLRLGGTAPDRRSAARPAAGLLAAELASGSRAGTGRRADGRR